MSRTTALFLYKVRFFFGPSLRSRFGPLAYILLIIAFVPTGYGFGVSIGLGLSGTSAARGINVLSTPLSGILALSLLYAIFSGVTAHVSEFDFFMTADVRPRQYLVSDLMFQFVSLFGAGGLAAVVSAFGIVSSVGRPLVEVFPLLACLFAFALLVLMIIQLLVVLRVRYPKAPVRSAALVLILLTLLPALSLAVPAFPLHFEGLLVPTTAFGTLGYELLMGQPLDLVSLLVAGATFALIVGAWLALSDTYIFHGIHPSLSAGFGQVDMAARMAQQQRMIGGLGRFTTRVGVRTDRGSDLGFMTRYHLLRIVRDGSLIFIVLFGAISILPVQFTGGGTETANAPLTYLATQILTFLVAILALNWSYYERENLWLVVTTAKTPTAYFRGLTLSFMTIGLIVAAAFVAVMVYTSPNPIAVGETAPPLAAAFAAAPVAAALLTRLKVQPSAFSFSMLAVLISVVAAGYMGGFGAQGLLLAVALTLGTSAVLQVSFLVMYCAALTAFGIWWVSRLALGFRL